MDRLLYQAPNIGCFGRVLFSSALVKNAAVSSIYNSQDMEATEVSINRWMDKEDVAHVYNGILLSHEKNETELFVVRWMDLETVIQSEVSQKEKNKYHMITHMYGI